MIVTKTVIAGLVREMLWSDGMQSLIKANYPMPAIPLSVHWENDGYPGMVYIDDDSVPNDPNTVYCYDSWEASRSR